MLMNLVPDPDKPGYFVTPEGERIFIGDYNEGMIRATFAFPRGKVRNSSRYELFQDTKHKDEMDLSIRTAGKLPAGQNVMVDWVGILPMNYLGNMRSLPSDMMKLAHAAYLKIEIKKNTPLVEGPLWAFPSGYGPHGQTNEENEGVITYGVPSTAHVSRLLRTTTLTNKHDLMGSVYFPNRDWLREAAGLKEEETMPDFKSPVGGVVFLHGMVEIAK